MRVVRRGEEASLGFNVSANNSSGLLGRAEERLQVVKPRLGCPVSALHLLYIRVYQIRYMSANMGITKGELNGKP